MLAPIKLYIPDYYNEKTINNNRLVFKKTKPLLSEDSNAAQFLISIENTKNYKCNIPEIGEYQSRATKSFHNEREEDWDLPITVSNCKVYTYSGNDKQFYFRIYWIVISEDFMLQLVGIFEPEYLQFYKIHFIRYFQSCEIDTDFDFSAENNPENLYNCVPVVISTDELQEQIDAAKTKENKAKFLAENLKVTNSDFYDILAAELKKTEEAIVENFMCTDWNMYYDLYNPENFSDPDSTVEWDDNSDVYEYYENPYTNNLKVRIECTNEICSLEALKNIVNNVAKVEQKLLDFFENYTFGNGGAYADAQHYKWAKIEIERLHKTTYTNQEFLKRNLCLEDIIISENDDEIKLYFNCSWDTEHGIDVIVDKNFDCKTD